MRSRLCSDAASGVRLEIGSPQVDRNVTLLETVIGQVLEWHLFQNFKKSKEGSPISKACYNLYNTMRCSLCRPRSVAAEGSGLFPNFGLQFPNSLNVENAFKLAKM